MQEEHARVYKDCGVTPEFHSAHNQYVLELVAVNGLLSKYQYHILPGLLQVKYEQKLQKQKPSFYRLGNGTITSRDCGYSLSKFTIICFFHTNLCEL